MVDDDENEENFLSDRLMTDSLNSRSGSGVNLPFQNLPKLTRHRKSDLMAYELEGNP